MKFCGLTVTSFEHSLGRNGQRGELRVYAVRDALAGDVPLVPPEGSPVAFAFGGLRFGGLLQQWGKEVSTGGETYTFTAVDPTDVLEAATVVTGGFVRAVPGSNLLNAYAWRENGFGFGAAGVNESGMPWANVRAALVNFFGAGNSAYGGPVNYRGVLYAVDLSEIPVGPAGYRVPAGATSLAQLLAQVCDDFQLDHSAQLDGLVVRVRTYDRSQQTNLGGVALALAGAGYAGLVANYGVGGEAAADATGAVLTGGPLSTVFVNDAVLSYWGDDLGAGAPIVGVPAAHPSLPGEPCEFFTLPCAEISDAVGDVAYPTNTVEMRCALGGYDVWMTYLREFKPAVAAQVKVGLFQAGPAGPGEAKNDLLADARQGVVDALNADNQVRAAVFYGWLRAYAEEFFGKRFLVRLDGVLVSPAGDFSARVDSGGWIPGGPGALGLGVLDQDKFSDESGRVTAFAELPNAVLLDPAELDPAATATVGGSLFVRATADPRLVAWGGAVYAKVDLGGPAYRRVPTDGGAATAAINNLDAAAAAKHQAGGTLGALSVHPHPQYPARVGVPATSTTDVYGPWTAFGAAGKVAFLQDPGLVPWEYGGEAAMNVAALAQVQAAASGRTRAEWAQATFAGIPLASAGDVISSGGPALTSVAVNYSTGGLTTTYRFAAHTPQMPGGVSRQFAEGLRRAAADGRDARGRAVQALARRRLAADGTRRARAARAFREHLPAWVKKQSPQEVVVAALIPSTGGGYRSHAAATTVEEAIPLAFPGDDAVWAGTAVSSWTAVVRPFEVAGPTGATAGGLPALRMRPALTGANAGAVTAGRLAHLNGPHDIEVLAWGAAYTGVNARRHNPGPTGARSVGLRGPVVIEGYGFGLDGAAWPSGGPSLPTGVRAQPDTWLAGYLDPLWCPTRGNWTVHDVYTGTAAAAIPSGGTGTFRVGGDAAWTLAVAAPYWGVPSGGPVVAAYAANEGRLVVIGPPSGAACPCPTGGSAVVGFCVTTGSGGVWTGGSMIVSFPTGTACLPVEVCPSGTGSCPTVWYCTSSGSYAYPVGPTPSGALSGPYPTQAVARANCPYSPPPPPPPPPGGTLSCCSPEDYYTLRATLDGGHGTMDLTWDGSTYWQGSKALGCGETLHLRYNTGCLIEYSCNGTNWLSVTPLPSITCTPFTDATTYACDMNAGGAGCAGGSCGTVNVTQVVGV